MNYKSKETAMKFKYIIQHIKIDIDIPEGHWYCEYSPDKSEIYLLCNDNNKITKIATLPTGMEEVADLFRAAPWLYNQSRDALAFVKRQNEELVKESNYETTDYATQCVYEDTIKLAKGEKSEYGQWELSPWKR